MNYNDFFKQILKDDKVYTVNEINNELAKNKLKTLDNQTKQMLLSSGKVREEEFQFLKNVNRNIKEMGEGLATIGSAGGQYIANAQYRDAMNKLGQNYLRRNPSVVDVAKDVANLGLSTYNTSVGDIKNVVASNNQKEYDRLLNNIAQGAYNSPVNTAFDFAMPISKATNAVAKDIPYVQRLKKLNDIDNIIRANKGNVGIELSPLQRSITGVEISKRKDLANVFDALRRTGETEKVNQEVLKNVQAASKSINKILQSEYGLPAKETDNVVLSTFIYERTKDISPANFNDIYKIVDKYTSKGKLSNNATAKIGLNPEEFKGLITSAQDLYNKDKLLNISEMGSNNIGNGTRVVDITRPNFLQARTVGGARPEDLAKSYPRFLDFMSNQFEKDKLVNSTLKDVTTKYGRPITSKSELLPNEVGINLSTVKKDLGDIVVGRNKEGNMSSYLEHLYKSGSETGDNLIAIDKGMVKKLWNTQREVAGWMKTISNATTPIKRILLSTSQYITGNRGGNIMGNIAGGVTPIDYAKSIGAFASKTLPERLKEETSFASYVGKDIVDLPILQAGKSNINKIKYGLEDAFAKNATAQERINALGRSLEGVNGLVTAPIHLTEASLERIDRGANLIKQIRKSGIKDWKSELKRMDTDKNLYSKYIQRVNNELGDYIGRNNSINPTVRSAFDNAILFNRFPLQTGRIEINMARKNPFKYQMNIGLPQKLGSKYWEMQKEAFNVPQYEGGGVLYNNPKSPDRGEPQVAKFNPYPWSAPFELVSSITDPSSDQRARINPAIAMAYNIIKNENRYGKAPTNPRYYQDKTTGKLIPIDNMGNIWNNGQELRNIGWDNRLRFASTQIGENYIAPYAMMNKTIMPFGSMAVKRNYYPRYDTTAFGNTGTRYIPGVFEGDMNRPKTPREIFNNMFLGISQYDPYQLQMSNRSMGKIKRNIIRKGRKRGND